MKNLAIIVGLFLVGSAAFAASPGTCNVSAYTTAEFIMTLGTEEECAELAHNYAYYDFERSYCYGCDQEN